MLNEEKIKQAIITADICEDVTNIKIDDLFKDHDFDSLDMFNLFIELQDLTSKELPDEDVDKLVSIQTIINYFNE